MRKSFSLVTGSVKIRILFHRPERILNAFSLENIKFRGLKRISANEIELNIPGGALSTVEALCKNVGADLTILSKRGALFFLSRFRKRYVLFFAPVITVILAFYLSFYIWEIEVTGNETVTKGEILSALEDVGVGIGTFGLGIDQEITRSHVIEDINKLSWLTVNVNGCRAEVIVRERTDRPEVVDERLPTEVRAAKTGIIEKMNVYAGKPLVREGETVILGETLVTGAVDSKSTGTRYVHAMGDIYARTWYEISAGIPLEYMGKDYTGRIIEKKSVLFGNIRVNMYLNAGTSMVNYDKITTVERLKLGSFSLPISVVKTVFREYEPQAYSIDGEFAESMLKERLRERLDELKKEAELVMTNYEIDNDNGTIYVTLRAECLEQIGIISPLTIPEPEKLSD